MSQELIFCPLCGNVIHRHFRTSVATTVRVPSRSRDTTAVVAELYARAREERSQELADAEQACVLHFQTNHRLRFRLWERFRKPWLIIWPRRHKSAPLPDQQIFEPLQFLKSR